MNGLSSPPQFVSSDKSDKSWWWSTPPSLSSWNPLGYINWNVGDQRYPTTELLTTVFYGDITNTDTMSLGDSPPPGITTEHNYNIYPVDLESDSIEAFVLNIAIPIIIGAFGVATNLINILIYKRMGLSKESVNISFFAMSIVDCLCMLALLWSGVCFACSIYTQHQRTFEELHVLTAMEPKNILSLISCWLTAFISFQRCICVTLPFKVKMILSPKRCMLSISIITFSLLLITIPIQYITEIGWDFSKTLYTVYNRVVNVGLRGLPILVVLICNFIVLKKVRASAKWRQRTSAAIGAGGGATLTSRSEESERDYQSTIPTETKTATAATKTALDSQTGKASIAATETTSDSQTGKASIAATETTLDSQTGKASIAATETTSDSQMGKGSIAATETTSDSQMGKGSTAATDTTLDSQTGRANQSLSSSNKETKLTKMIIVISIVFFLCYAPYIIVQLLIEFSYWSLALPRSNVLSSIKFIFEGFNASCNIIIFYKMSSRYKYTFDQVIRRKV